MDDLSGRTLLSRFRVVRRLGVGGAASVYEVEDLALGRALALKVLHPSLQQSPSAEARFRREARFGARVSSPHVVRTLDVGELEDGATFVLMDRVRGGSLADRLGRDGRLSIDEAVTMARQVCLALEAAHALGVLHRDLKPDNILLDADGSAKVADFGLLGLLGDSSDEHGELTGTGMLVGTPRYMSPEQARTGALDPRSDVYSVGAVLYEALSGEPAIRGRDVTRVLQRIQRGEVASLAATAPHVPPRLVAVVERAMSLEPDDRYPTAAALERALRRAHRGHPAPSAPRAATAGPLGRGGRGRVALATLAVAGVSLLVGGALALLLSRAAGSSGVEPSGSRVEAAVERLRRIADLAEQRRWDECVALSLEDPDDLQGLAVGFTCATTSLSAERVRAVCSQATSRHVGSALARACESMPAGWPEP